MFWCDVNFNSEFEVSDHTVQFSIKSAYSVDCRTLCEFPYRNELNQWKNLNK